MSKILTPKVLIVGGGPGGYVAAIRCGQLGLDTVLVEASGVGGTCLLRGCIPSKAIIQASEQFATLKRAKHHELFGMKIEGELTLDFADTVAWKDGVVSKLNSGVTGLLKKSGVNLIEGWAQFSDAKTCTVETAQSTIEINAENIILATGSIPMALPNLEFSKNVLSSTEVLSLDQLPKELVVVGGGYIGLELGNAFINFGVDVTIVEATGGILSQYDRKLVGPVQRALVAKGVKFRFDVKATGFKNGTLSVENNDGVSDGISADKVLLTVGRRPNLEGWGFENTSIELAGTFIKVDAQCNTSTKGVWAIGDIVGEPMLAHKASAQGKMVAEIIAGKRRQFDPVAIPAVCFTDPEIVSVGVAPNEMPGTKEYVFPFSANGRALTLSSEVSDGFVRVIALENEHRIVGVQAVGKHIAELAAIFVTAVETGLTLEEIGGIIYPHPTLGEAFHEAVLKGLGHPIHI